MRATRFLVLALPLLSACYTMQRTHSMPQPRSTVEVGFLVPQSLPVLQGTDTVWVYDSVDELSGFVTEVRADTAMIRPTRVHRTQGSARLHPGLVPVRPAAFGVSVSVQTLSRTRTAAMAYAVATPFLIIGGIAAAIASNGGTVP